MEFHSGTFIIFLAVSFTIYWYLGRKHQNILLLAASYLFYSWWDWRFLFLIIFSSLVDFYASNQMSTTLPEKRKKWLYASILVNLGTLCTFKYFNFFVDSFTHILNTVGFQANHSTLNIILPVGISFYTFQSMAYTIDVYRKKIPATNDLVAFLSYVAFFPQLVAGPIERASSLLGQISSDRHFDLSLAKDGCRQILYGLVVKVVIADNIAPLVDQAYGNTSANGWQLIVGTVLFAFQIYCDFNGYSSIAIGVSKLFGIRLCRNFNYPYFSRNMVEFWNRWHISLSTWFRDYVYIPLGGSHSTKYKTARNLLLTFGLSGLWHGAGVNYLIWGIYHGFLIILIRNRVTGKRSNDLSLLDLPAVFGTFFLACIGWVFFRASSFSAALTIFHKMTTDIFSTEALLKILNQRDLQICVTLISVMLIVEYIQRHKEHAFQIEFAPLPVRWFTYACTFILIAALGKTVTIPFIYFQF